jgi:O-antigen ligase
MAAPTTAGGQRYLLGVWIFMSVLTPTLGFLGARGFAPALGVLGLLCLPLVRPRGRDWVGLGILGLVVAFASISALWSPITSLNTAKAIGRFTGLHLLMQLLFSSAFVIAAARLDVSKAETSLTWLGFGLLAQAVILVIEGLTQAGIYQSLQGVITDKVRPDLAVRNVAVGGYVLAALFWPVAATFWRQGRKQLVIALVLAVGFSTVFLRGDSPTIALVLSALIFALVLKGGRPAVLATGAVAMIYWLTTPWAMLALQKAGVFDILQHHLPASWRARLDIWSFTNAHLLSSPLRGWGLDASRAFPGKISLHPHDAAVQIWFELGVAGAVLAAAFWGFIFWRIARDSDDRFFAATACACATVYLVIGAISFSLWQDWWIGLGALAMAACVALRRFVDKPIESWTYQMGAPPEAA